MAVWLVRAGRRGQQEQAALDHDLVTIAWNERPDLSGITKKDALADLYRQRYPNASSKRASNNVGQVWAFRERMKEGDLAVLPLHIQSAIAIGKITGPYLYRTDLGEDIHHTRPVEWIRTDIPRTVFDQDILYSFGAFMTVCQIRRNNAEERIRAVLQGKPVSVPAGTDDDNGDEEETLDIEQAARDQLLEYIQSKYAGHKLAELVDAVLQAQGYLTRVSPPGPDGGVDILAGSGPLGFGEPQCASR